MKLSIDENLKGKELYDHLVQNKKAYIAQKKYEIKRADPFRMSGFYVDQHGDVQKAAPATENTDPTALKVTAIINTTFWFDSHKDVHIDGLWKKSLSETKDMYHVQEHDLSFKGIISEEVKAFTKLISWRSLGVDFPGETQALVFNSTVAKKRNEFMFDQYRQGYVKNHSVGMQYVTIELAVNDEDYKEEFAVWNKFIDRIANKSDVEDNGYFWAVREAKAIEGSAVVRGSNTITPTQSVEEVKAEPGTQDQPSLDTVIEPHKGAESFDIKQLLSIF